MDKLVYRKILADNLKKFRKKNGISQEELASMANFHRTYIGSVERCERNISLAALVVLSKTLGITVPELLTKKS